MNDRFPSWIENAQPLGMFREYFVPSHPFFDKFTEFLKVNKRLPMKTESYEFFEIHDAYLKGSLPETTSDTLNKILLEYFNIQLSDIERVLKETAYSKRVNINKIEEPKNFKRPYFLKTKTKPGPVIKPRYMNINPLKLQSLTLFLQEKDRPPHAREIYNGCAIGKWLINMQQSHNESKLCLQTKEIINMLFKEPLIVEKE